jgi:SAM-dependent methyltransferase
MLEQTSIIVACPECHGSLQPGVGTLHCPACDLSFSVNDQGFLEFMRDQTYCEKISTTEEKAGNQSSSGANRVDDEYVMPWLMREPFERVLDVGCGVGRIISKLAAAGKEAYGVDLPCLAGFWSQDENDPEKFFHAEASRLPFPDDYFDVVISMGVIEHIGTGKGHCTLPDDYRRQRQQYADELLRVARPGGRLLISCPNKSFPVDHLHEVKDMYSPDTLETRIRDRIYRRTGMNVHRTWGKYHLLSYGEMRRHFCEDGNGSIFIPLPLKGYFGLTMFESGRFKPLRGVADIYFNKMPRIARASFLNPYVLAEIRK